MEDPAADDDKVPTKVKYNKVTRLMIPVFDILGVVPGYREYDISFWFLGFFTLFFAMIIGDAGYGCLFLLAALVMTVKGKKAVHRGAAAVAAVHCHHCVGRADRHLVRPGAGHGRALAPEPGDPHLRQLSRPTSVWNPPPSRTPS